MWGNSMGFTYTEVRDNYLLLREESKDFNFDELEIPSHCFGEYGCGAELEFTDNLTQLYCPNRYCFHKIAARLEMMAKELQVDGFGEATCLELAKKLKLKSPAMIFLLTDENIARYGSMIKVSALETKMSALKKAASKPRELWEAIKLLNIPGIASNARKVFNGYTDIEKAYDDIESGQVMFVANRLGLTINSNAGILASTIYNTLIEFKEEIVFGVGEFVIEVAEGEVINIVISETPSDFGTKNDYITYLNDRYKGKLHFVKNESVTAKCDILVAPEGAGTGKYKKAMAINEKAKEKGSSLILILDADQLVKKLDSMYKESN